MQFKHVTLDIDGPVAILKLDHQEVMNAVSMDMLGGLAEALDAIDEKKAEVRCLVLTGAGRAFCTGADVEEIPDDGRVIYDEPYLSTNAQWEAPQEGTPPFRTMTKPISSHRLCLESLRTNLLALMGALSSLIRWLRSPSVTFSHHMKIQVQTLCGQV